MSTAPVPERTDYEVRIPTEITNAAGYFKSVSEVIARLPFQTINLMADTLVQAYLDNRAVLLFGNGGSAALASHLACDLGKGTIVDGTRRFRVLSLADNVPLITAWANDSQYENIFAEQLLNIVQPNDVALAISGSGNSPNVLNGLRAARQGGAATLGLTGYQGGKMKSLCDICVVVPSDNMQHIEDLHLSITHAIFTGLRYRIREIAAQKPRPVGALEQLALARPHLQFDQLTEALTGKMSAQMTSGDSQK